MNPKQYCLFDSPEPIDFQKLLERREQILTASWAPSTLRAYSSAWGIFKRWCYAADRESLPTTPETICDFAVWTLEQGMRLQTMRLRLKAIAHYHRTANLPVPTRTDVVRRLLSAAARELKEEPGGKWPITVMQLKKIMLLDCTRPAQIRNLIMLLVAFASGWRRSELVALDYSDVQFVLNVGMRLWQRQSKVDQEGRGRYVGIHYARDPEICPVRALERWIKMRGDWQGPLFTGVDRDGETLNRNRMGKRADQFYVAIKRYMAAIGEDPRNYGAHSTRVGMVTAAFETGASTAAIKMRTGHKDTRTLEEYFRPVNAFNLNPMTEVL